MCESHGGHGGAWGAWGHRGAHGADGGAWWRMGVHAWGAWGRMDLSGLMHQGNSSIPPASHASVLRMWEV